MLEDLDRQLDAKSVSLIFAELKSPVQEKVEKYELTGKIEPGHFFPTITEAVKAYRTKTGAEWTS